MNYETTELEYKRALEDIYLEANKLSSLETFNKNLNTTIHEYKNMLNIFSDKSKEFIENYDKNKEQHIQILKNKLLEFDINNELKIYQNGDIYNHIDIVEKYLEENLYVKELEIIVAINIYSTFKSIISLSKKKYPHLKKVLTQKKNSLQFNSKCPFCKNKFNIDIFKRTKPYKCDLDLKEILTCNCSLPNRWNNYTIDDLMLIYKLVNPNNKLTHPNLSNKDIETLKTYTKEKYSKFYTFSENYIKIYNDDKDFKVCSIDKQLWAKIKKDDFSFNYYEQQQLNKIPNSLTYGIQIYSLNNVINNLIFSVTGNGEIYKVKTSCNFNPYETLTKINSNLITYIQNYQKKPLQKNENEQNEVLALGYYCKANDINIIDLNNYTSLVDYCKKFNINFEEIKEVISRSI